MRIDVFHDTVCPWCRIGKRNLDLALVEWDAPGVIVRWRPFLLDPSVPEEGVDFRAYMAGRKGVENLPSMFEAVRRAGTTVGLDFRFDRVRFATNTILSHRLIAVAPEERRSDLIDAIHRAYFEAGRDIGDPETLVAIAAEVGLDPDSIRSALEGDQGAMAVQEEVATARAMGIAGVPLMVLDGQRVVSGARSTDAIVAALRSTAAPRVDSTPVAVRSA